MCLTDETKEISLQDCRLVTVSSGLNSSSEIALPRLHTRLKSPFVPFYSIKSCADEDSSWITLQQDSNTWQADLKDNVEIMIFRDDSSLKSLFDKAIYLSDTVGVEDDAEAKFCGKCNIHELKYPFPCALVLASTMKSLEVAVNRADSNFPREIWECINFTTLDLHVRQAPIFKGKDLSKYITPKRSAIHEYRTSWVASRGTSMMAPTSSKKKGEQEEGNLEGEGSKANADSLGLPGNCRSGHEIHERRFVLWAETQIGKTGTYFYFLSLLKDLIRTKSEPLPPDSPCILSRNTVEFAKHDWMRPYWRYLSKDEWGQKGNLYVKQGKYHPRMKLQRCVPIRV